MRISSWLATFASLILVLPMTEAAQAQTKHKVLYSFKGPKLADGAFPFSSLIKGAEGSLYGVSAEGGIDYCFNRGCGTVFKISKSGAETVLHSFTGGNDGYEPESGLLQDAAGNLYGVALGGGFFSYGTVFKVSPNGKFTVLYAFTGGVDGANPESVLVSDPAGNLYGTTYFGGSGNGNSGYGTVFKLDVTGNVTILHTFTGGSDGAYPSAGLARDAAGNIYGTTLWGGSGIGFAGSGVVFKIDSGGSFTVLYSFTGGADGGNPDAALLQDTAGNLYGTTLFGGSGIGTVGHGTVFKLDSSGVEKVLYTFTGGADGAFPSGALITDTAGNFYSTTAGGGAPGYGTVFELDSKDRETVLYSFTGGEDGAYPYATLARDAAGNLYGTTGQGGASGSGTVFEVAH